MSSSITPSVISFVNKSLDFKVVAKIALLVAIITYFVSRPEAYQLSNKFTHKTADSQGNPTHVGRGVHAVVTGAVVAGIIFMSTKDILSA